MHTFQKESEKKDISNKYFHSTSRLHQHTFTLIESNVWRSLIHLPRRWQFNCIIYLLMRIPSNTINWQLLFQTRLLFLLLFHFLNWILISSIFYPHKTAITMSHWNLAKKMNKFNSNRPTYKGKFDKILNENDFQCHQCSLHHAHDTSKLSSLTESIQNGLRTFLNIKTMCRSQYTLQSSC